MNYYSENDPYCVRWLENLIFVGAIPDGHVDSRSIVDVTHGDLKGYTQCHFFAGIAGWSLALKLAGWSGPAWTGSCPCQPFSAAGASAGFDDERHLWPHFERLIRKCKPSIVFGEQVASKAADVWIDLVLADLERMDYAGAAIAFPSASVGAPHIRDRTYWLGYANNARSQGHAGHGGAARRERQIGSTATASVPVRMADTDSRQFERLAVLRGDVGDGKNAGRQKSSGGLTARSKDGRLADVSRERFDEARERFSAARRDGATGDGDAVRPGPVNGAWGDADWLHGRDGKWRPVESGAQQMVDGISSGVGRLRSDHDAQKAIADAANAVGLADQVLRALQCGYGPEAVWRSLGGCIGVSQATLLLSSLCKQSRQLGRIFYSAAPGSSKVQEELLRELRSQASSIARPPQRRGHAQQFDWQLGNTLPQLSQAMPRLKDHLAALNGFSGSPLATDVFSRIGRLKAYGNAINPHQAAEFIRAVMP